MKRIGFVLLGINAFWLLVCIFFICGILFFQPALSEMMWEKVSQRIDHAGDIGLLREIAHQLVDLAHVAARSARYWRWNNVSAWVGSLFLAGANIMFVALAMRETLPRHGAAEPQSRW